MEKITEPRTRDESPNKLSTIIDRSFMTDIFPKEEINYRDKFFEYHNTLTTHVLKLDSHIETVLQKHEQDFLNAFKCQMFNLYSQLKELKKKNDENEIKLLRDEQINKLQNSLEWFREEAVKLGESTQFYKKEADKWKAKSESLEDDRKFLENQLKNTKRKIKLLQIEKNSPKDSIDSLKTSAFQTFDLSSVKFYPSTKSGEIILELLHKNLLKLEDFLYDLEKYFHDVEIKYNESIKHIKNSLDAEKKKARTISQAQTSVFFVKSDLESLFLECVEEVRKDITRRKAQNFVTQKFAKRAGTTQNIERNVMTGNDKRKILELLISNEQVLVLLYEKLFPYRATQYGEKGKTEEKKNNDTPSLEELLKMIPSKGPNEKISIYPYRGKSVS